MHQGKKVDRSGAPLTPAVPFLRVSHTYSADPFSHVCNALQSQHLCVLTALRDLQAASAALGLKAITLSFDGPSWRCSTSR